MVSVDKNNHLQSSMNIYFLYILKYNKKAFDENIP